MGKRGHPAVGLERSPVGFPRPTDSDARHFQVSEGVERMN